MGPITSDVNHCNVSQNSQHGQQLFIKKEKNLARALCTCNGLHDCTLSPASELSPEGCENSGALSASSGPAERCERLCSGPVVAHAYGSWEAETEAGGSQ